MLRTACLLAAILAVKPLSASAQALVNGSPQVTISVPNQEYLNSAGARMSPNIPFYRIGEPFIIPFTPTSGNVEVPVTPPAGTTSFQYTNNNPCAVRFRGRLTGAPTVVLTAANGWLWLPGTSRVYTSLLPVAVMAMGIDGPNASVQAAQKACSGNVEPQFGTGQ